MNDELKIKKYVLKQIKKAKKYMLEQIKEGKNLIDFYSDKNLKEYSKESIGKLWAEIIKEDPQIMKEIIKKANLELESIGRKLKLMRRQHLK